MKRVFSRGFLCGLLFLLSFLPPVFSQKGETPEEKTKKFCALIEGAKKTLERYREAIHKSSFDLDEMAKELGKDPEMIHAFVRDEIRFEPYQGVLRGPTGTLRSRAGNSLDKALLLQALLKRGGHQSRLAFGKLDGEKAKILLDQSRRERLSDDETSFDLPYFFENPSLMKERHKAVLSFQNHLLGRYSTLHKVLLKATEEWINRNEKKEGPTKPEGHFWVQIKTQKGYQNLDPSFEGAQAGETFAKAEETLNKVPKKLYHRVSLRGFCEVYNTKSIIEKRLFQISYNASELAGLPVILDCIQLKGPLGGFGSALAGKEKKYFLRLRQASKTVATGSFSFQKGTHKKKRGGLGGFGGFGGALGGGKKRENLTLSLGVEIELLSPGKGAIKIRRYLFDLWGPGNRAAKTLAALKKAKFPTDLEKTVQKVTLSFGLETGYICPAYFQYKQISNTLHLYKSIRVKKDRVSLSNYSGDWALQLTGETYCFLFDRMARSQLGFRWYIESPRLTMVRLEQKPKKVSLQFDVTHSSYGVLNGSSDFSAKKTNLGLGVISSLVEEELLVDPLKEPSNQSGFGSALSLERSLSTAPPLVIGSLSDLPPLPISSRGLMEQALQKGWIVILPALKKTPSHLSWYEFDGQTGRLIATVETGLHQSTTEKAILEKDDAAKTGAASRFGNTCRGIMRCVVRNVDGLAFLLIDAGTGGLSMGNAMDAAQGIAECLSKTGATPHPSSKADDAARKFFGKKGGSKFNIGKNKFGLDKDGLKHILERHHPNYWNGTIKKTQTFVEKSMGPKEMVKAIKEILKQNKDKILSSGKGQVTGTYKGRTYTVGFKGTGGFGNRRRIGQFFPGTP